MDVDSIHIDGVVAGCLAGERRRIVIPSFGAFIKRPEGGLAFIDILNSDDGKLNAELQRRLGLTGDEARRAAEKYAHRLKTELLYNKRVEIDGIGTLCMTADGSFEIYPPSPGGTGAPEESVAGGNARQTEIETKPEPAPAPEAKSAGSEQISEPEEQFTTEPGESGEDHGAGIPVSGPENAEPNPEIETAAAIREPLVPGDPAESGVSDSVKNDFAEPAEVAASEESVPDTGEPEPEYGIRSLKDREMLRSLLYGDDDTAEIEAKYEALSAAAEPVATTEPAATAEPAAAAHLKSEPEQPGYASTAHRESELEGREDRIGRTEPAAQEDVRQVQLRRPKKKRVDVILVIAIIAIIVAAAVIIYGETAVGNLNIDLKELMHGVQPETSSAL